MRWRAHEFRDNEDWHKWFAWRPVVVDGRWVWLETVERKLTYPHSIGGFIWRDYRNVGAGADRKPACVIE
jgi:hypothetical protein